MGSPDEKAAAKIWKEYHAAIKELKLDDKGVSWPNIEYMHDGFFAGFYAGRDYQKGKTINHKAGDAAHKVLHGHGSSKAEKTKRGSALTQR